MISPTSAAVEELMAGEETPHLRKEMVGSELTSIAVGENENIIIMHNKRNTYLVAIV